ncbi:NUDIX hydrolase [Solihabitans fulvus]|uniref:NUDIX hydrolase n=2 Tax=Solihabitans fulvus TaxID=1892852 RepID=A0A5B2WNS0_9PSEU|nr:NUDIX hydrolase [Solihabitans fulvus]
MVGEARPPATAGTPETVGRDRIPAAGAVLWRPGPDGGEPAVAVVHRPRYDDWSLPKGKLDSGETVPAAAVREVTEETGCTAVLGPFLGRVEYPIVRRGRAATKVVDYFSARATGGEFAVNDEVDELRWLPVPEAAALLSYPHDRGVLAEFAALPRDTRTLLLTRHAKAGKREHWAGDDELRPLSPAGRRQAEALRGLLPLFGADRVHAAPRVRCVQTVEGLAEDLAAPVVREPLLSEEGYWPNPEIGAARLMDILAGGGAPVVSSQGGVIPHLVTELARRGGLDLGTIACKKGSVWVLSFAAGHAVSNSDGVPQLVAAHYLPSPLPAPAMRA